MACFELEEVKTLLRAWESEKALQEENEYLKDKIELQVDKLKYLEDVIEVKDVSLKWLQEDNARLSKKWEEENKKRYKAENSVTKKSSIAWTTTAALGIFIVGMLVAR